MCAVCRQLAFQDVWKLFGEGRHPQARQLYESKLAPFLTQASGNFWSKRLWYFDKGLYYQGGQVSCLDLFSKSRDPQTTMWPVLLGASNGHLYGQSSLLEDTLFTFMRLLSNRTLRTLLMAQGGVVYYFQLVTKLMGLGNTVKRLTAANTLEVSNPILPSSCLDRASLCTKGGRVSFCRPFLTRRWILQSEIPVSSPHGLCNAI